MRLLHLFGPPILLNILNSPHHQQVGRCIGLGLAEVEVGI